MFSFGLTVFEMLTGRQALAEEAPVKLLLKLQTQELGPELATEVDQPYRGLLTAMLARDARQRPAMAEVLRRLATSRGAG